MTEKRDFIPLFDLDIGEPEIEAVAAVLRSKWLTMGEVTGRFEAEFAEYVGAPFCLAVGNGTAALHLALLACGIGPGDEVICPSLTFVATANAVLYTGATPVFADINGVSDLNISPESIARQISQRTKAILVVHYAGYPCDMKAIMGLAAANGLKVVEDAAHAPGAAFVWRDEAGKEVRVQKAGTIGDAGCFSFFSNKNLAVGEGGMVVTRHEDIAEKVRLMRSHGMTSLTWDRHKGHSYSYDVVALGYNYRTDEMRAAIGRKQLEKLDSNNRRRNDIDRLYRKLFSDTPELILPFGKVKNVSSHHIFPVILPDHVDRPQFMEKMRHAKGIQTSIHYPPVHTFELYRRIDHRGPIDLGKTEAVGGREVTLPLYPGLTDDHAAYIVDSVKELIK